MQWRTFKFHSLPCLIYQKQVEAEAKLDDSGTVVLSGGAWTHVFKHNAFSLLRRCHRCARPHHYVTYGELKPH